MTIIGAAWLKQKEVPKEENATEKEYYYTISIDDAILPLTIDKTKRLILKENKNKGENEKAPNFYLEIYVPDTTKTKQPKDPNIIKDKKENKNIDYFTE